MKYLILLLTISYMPTYGQVLSDNEVNTFALVVAELSRNLPDQQMFGERVVKELNVSAEDVNRINNNVGRLSASDQKVYAKMGEMYQQELETISRQICDKYKMNYHFYLQMYTLYEGDERFKELVNNKIYNFKLDRQ